MSIFKRGNKVEYNYNYYNYNNEIDYNECKKMLIDLIEEQKPPKRKNNKVRTFIMKLCNGVLYVFQYFICIYLIHFTWTSKAQGIADMSITSKAIFSIVIGVIGLGSFLSMLESYDDNEKEVQKYFDSNIGFIALIIAVIALFKGGA